eukprot:GEMP01105740.1.p1 GENE.GEMP01105740.1~~GEMP01105740.1.p1  ORF type:complete len:108 (+),score=30.06 GEMP01105740.1:196-519(+)
MTKKQRSGLEKTTLKKIEKTSKSQGNARSLTVFDRLFLIVLAAFLILPWIYTPPIVRELAHGLESFMRMEGDVSEQVAPSAEPVDTMGHNLDQSVVSNADVSKNDEL